MVTATPARHILVFLFLMAAPKMLLQKRKKVTDYCALFFFFACISIVVFHGPLYI